jgi:hypothetical protein
MRLTAAFEQFHDNIALSPLSEERINRAWGRLHRHLTSSYGLPDQFVFIQGSYANDTAVKPADSGGEYDLDLVCVGVEAGTPAEAAIEELAAVLARDGDLESRIEPNESGRPCVRLRYADDPEGFGFHVDIVPARGADPTAVLEVPMRGFEEWRESAPYAYTKWCQEQPELFSRLVRFLKRWRDEHGDGSITSITLQVLIAASLAASPETPPRIPNPVLGTEDLGERWGEEDYREFRAELEEAVSLADAALAAPDAQLSHDTWRALFGEDFPATPGDVEDEGGEGPPASPPPPDRPDPRQQAPADERYG